MWKPALPHLDKENLSSRGAAVDALKQVSAPGCLKQNEPEEEEHAGWGSGNGAS